MPTFSINSGGSTTFTDTTPGGGMVINFARLDNSLNVQINGVDLFVGGPSGAPNEVEFQTNGTNGQTIRFADGDQYGTNTPEIWQMSGTNTDPIFRLEINPDGTVGLYGVKFNGGPLEPLELFNGMSVNTTAIAAAWNDSGDNTIVVDQIVTGPTNASGEATDVPCFTAGTMIETEDGPKRIEDLKVSDKVMTYDNGLQPVRWIGTCELSELELTAQPHLKPIHICAGALGSGFPRRDLIVSPQHRVLVSSSIALRMFKQKEILIPAKKLLSLDGVYTVSENLGGVTYYHLLFEQHEIIWSNGALTESLFVGQEALKSVSAEARREIRELFPECFTEEFQAIAARPIPKTGHLMNRLVERHNGNQKPLIDMPCAPTRH